MTTNVSDLDVCTSEQFLGQISTPHRLQQGNTPVGRRLSAETKDLELDVFYENPRDNGIRTPESLKLRKQYDALRTDMPYRRQEYINRLHKLRSLKEQILALEVGHE